MFNNVGIVGVGLIGSSLALEIRENKLAQTIFGFDLDKNSLNTALQNGIIDGYGTLDEIDICDFVIVATPVGAIADVLKSVFHRLKSGSIVIDVGSVKGAIVDGVKDYLREDVYYVPIHPIAGIEKFGVDAAKIGLFKNAYCIITPFDTINRFALDKIKNLIKILGMKLELMNPDEHDEVFAYISHLPHLAAYGLVGLAEEKKDEKFKFIGGGFRDFTRIAASSEKMWSDIFFLNKDKLLKALNSFEKHIDRIKTLINNNDTVGLIEYLRQARLFKESLYEK